MGRPMASRCPLCTRSSSIKHYRCYKLIPLPFVFHFQISLSTYIAEGNLSQIVPSYKSIPLPPVIVQEKIVPPAFDECRNHDGDLAVGMALLQLECVLQDRTDREAIRRCQHDQF